MKLLSGLVFSLLATFAHAAQNTYIKCSPAKLSPGAMLTIQYKMTGTPEIAVTNPAGQQTFIAHHLGEKRPIGSVKIKIGEATPVPDFTGGVSGTKNIFDRPGKYKVEAGDISVGDSPDFGECVVEILGARTSNNEKSSSNQAVQTSSSGDAQQGVRAEASFDLGKTISNGLKNLFSGFQQPQQAEGESGGSATEGHSDTGAEPRIARKTGGTAFPKSLIGIFKKFPAYDAGRIGWPRIAVTVLDDGSSGCTAMRAKIWHTAGRSETKQFSICEGDVARLAGIGGVKGAGTSQQMKDFLLGMPSRADQALAGADRVIAAPSECFASQEDLRRLNKKRPAVCDELNTPINSKLRTEGPSPAPEPLPDEARSMFNRVKDRFSDLALITHYDPSNDDRRLWMVKYDLNR